MAELDSKTPLRVCSNLVDAREPHLQAGGSSKCASSSASQSATLPPADSAGAASVGGAGAAADLALAAASAAAAAAALASSASFCRMAATSCTSSCLVRACLLFPAVRLRSCGNNRSVDLSSRICHVSRIKLQHFASKTSACMVTAGRSFRQTLNPKHELRFNTPNYFKKISQQASKKTL